MHLDYVQGRELLNFSCLGPKTTGIIYGGFVYIMDAGTKSATYVCNVAISVYARQFSGTVNYYRPIFSVLFRKAFRIQTAASLPFEFV